MNELPEERNLARKKTRIQTLILLVIFMLVWHFLAEIQTFFTDYVFGGG